MTGGAGFIGSHLVDELVRRGRTVRVLDNLSTGRQANIEAHVREGTVDLVVGDVRDAGTLAHAARGCTTIFHLAASVGVGEVTRAPLSCLENNLEGVLSLVGYARSVSPSPRLVYFSSSEVYGKSGDAPLVEDGTFVIGPANSPRWSYAAGKIAGEYLALGSGDSHGIPVTVVRCFNTSGPRQMSTYGMVIPRFFEQAMAGDPITVYGDGSQTRCFSYVGDVVENVLRLESDPAANGEVFNVGSNERISVLDLAERIRGLTGSSSRIVFVPFDDAYGPGFEESSHRVPDLAKLEQVTGSRRFTSLADLLGRYLEWVRARDGASDVDAPDAPGGRNGIAHGGRPAERAPREPGAQAPSAVGPDASRGLH
ncbi:MAG: NAD-dependent epimerase/dehydratase family protein [Candidatus Eisenbacteria bacterium]